ncbi:delta(1)-pyrroline-2-carboxylate reductase family protein [Brucella tritici]|uniref:delta(1)-pyrroline-2-carboxylate reductase family protein n=1 Tax=Brucella tritici TaxID=94626 RepID=UPI00124E7BE9|nr:delta(1)-pyrroline-2-carboxylate reductase family protein [Brucella tritici]KAB2679624.1 delta(1)-pyrroline-2-carboxylate reductase family protein [Brucella tritici]
MQFFNAAETAQLLHYPGLISALTRVLAEYGRGEIQSPERMVVPCGAGGLLLSMPCQARDVVVHKLLTIYAANPGRHLPTIQGQVTCFDAETGVPLFCLDGPTVTARRTAAITMIGIDRLRPQPPRLISIIGTGAQAAGHVKAMLERYPEAEIRIRGASHADERSFCERFSAWKDRVAAHAAGPVGGDVVVAVTSSKVPVYDEAADPARLVIGVGAYRLDMIEIGARTIAGSQVYVDDPVGAPVEAGDVVAAGTDWSGVVPLASSFDRQPDFSRPIFLKSVGCGAWDLAACRAARTALTD